MKLTELLAAKSLQKLTPDELLQKLKSSGFFKRELGRGKRGIAFELRDGTVLKAWVNDPGYEEWIKYCATHSSKYHVKVLSKVKEFKTDSQTFKYVRLEKLQKSKNGWAAAEIKDLNGFSEDLCGFLNSTYPPYAKALKVLRDELQTDDPNLKLLELTQTIINIANAMRGEGFKLDLHLNNFGMRQDQPVIIDPLHADDEYFDAVELQKVLKDT